MASMKRSTAVPGTFEAPMDTELMGLVASLFYSFTIFQRDNHSMACKLGELLKINTCHLGLAIAPWKTSIWCLTCKSREVGLVWTENIGKHLPTPEGQLLKGTLIHNKVVSSLAGPLSSPLYLVHSPDKDLYIISDTIS